jgi:adenylate kinase
LLQEQSGACQISTGDILRKAVAEQTPLGKEASRYLTTGALVPDDVIVNLVADRLKAKDCENGFILDGFPRTIPQAQGLEEMLNKMGLDLQAVLSIQVPNKLIVERLAGRRTCKRCGALYHLSFDPPKAEAVCDRCSGELYQRDDDREETITARLKVYDNQTAPLENYYRERGLLRSLNGVGTVDDIHSRMIKSLGE